MSVFLKDLVGAMVVEGKLLGASLALPAEINRSSRQASRLTRGHLNSSSLGADCWIALMTW